MSLNPAYPDGSGGGDSTVDNTTEGHFAVKLSEALSDGTLTQDPDGKIRASEQIIAEKGVDSTPATYVSGDGLDISSSGPQQINKSRITNVRYQIPYQEVDSTGSGDLFNAKVYAEVHEERQDVFDTQLTPPSSYSVDVIKNEVVNAFYIKTDGDVNNYRFQMIAQPSGNVIVSYPDKFRYARDEGAALIGSGIHKIDLFYTDQSAPTRLTEGQNIDFIERWETAGGFLLGNSLNKPWYEVDVQEFDLVDVVDKNTVLSTETSTELMQFVLDEDDLSSDSNTKVATQQSVKAYVDDMVSSSIRPQDGYDALNNIPNLEVAPTGVLEGYLYAVSVAGEFFSVHVEVGDTLISKRDDPSEEEHWIILNRNLDASTIKALYESNDNTNAFEDLDKAKLLGIDPLADVNNISDVDALDLTNGGESPLHYHTSDRDRANHTGNQLSSTISDFSTSVSTIAPNVTLSVDDTTQEALGLIGQELTVSLVTQTTDGAMSAEDKLKLDNIYASGSINADFVEINSDVDLSTDTNFIVDTTSNVVNINIPFGITSPFTVRDAYKKFNKTYSCIINVKDSGGATVHTAELDKKDKGWVFYFNGTDWAYGEIGKGKIIVVSSDHIASTDFGILNVASDDYTYEEIDGGIMYKAVEDMVDDPRSLVSKSYVDNLPSGGSSEYGELYTVATGTQAFLSASPVIWDASGVYSGITVSSGNVDPIDDKITILSGGVHKIEFIGSAYIKKNETYTFYIYVNGIETYSMGERMSTVDNITVPFGFSKLLSLSASDYVQVYIGCSSSKEFYLVSGTTFNIFKL